MSEPVSHERIRLGISACLLGQRVRFDGGHKRDPFLVESLGAFVEWVPVCPEVESGMGAPRESMRLVLVSGDVRLLTNKSVQDQTAGMHSYARRRVVELADDELFGFVLKKDSPTCGLERVKVYGTGGVPLKSGRGLFAEALVTRFPLLPVEEEGRLNDPRLRENFVDCGGRPSAVAAMVTDSAPAFALLLRRLARLDGHAADNHTDLGAFAERRPRLDPRVIGDVLALTSGASSSGVDPARLFPAYLAAVEQLSRFIDTWQLA